MRKSFALLLVFAFLSSSCLGVVQPQTPIRPRIPGAIIIMEDGSVSGTDNIHRDGNIYTLTGDIEPEGAVFSAIEVLKDNIVIDGAHFSVRTKDSARVGIDLSGRSNVVVKNLVIEEFQHGVFLESASGNTIYGNQIIGFSGSSLAVPTGIWVSSSSNNRIESNNVSSNVEYGILVQAASTGNIISGNIITGNGVGLVLDYCPNNVLRDNQIYGNEHNFKLGYNTYSQFVQDIDSSNLIEGKPVYYWIDEHDKTVPSDAGFVALGDCTNIRVEGLEIRNNYDSITLINTNNSVILDNYLEKCGNGIFLKYCHDVTVTGNTITGNVESGISTLAGSNIEVSENIIDSSRYGISTAGQTSSHTGGSGSANITIYKNIITGCFPGIHLSFSRHNLISNNYFEGNVMGINAVSSSQNLIVENTFVENTMGAVRISGSQNNTFYHNNFIDNDANGIQIFNPWIVAGNPEDNFWDTGSEGNYWSDFTQRYPNATETPSGHGQTPSDVWDTNYYINEKNIDRYPLVAPLVPPVTPPDADSPFSEFAVVLSVVSILLFVVVIAVGFLVYLNKRQK